MVSADSYLRMSSGYARLSRPTICSDEQPSTRCVLTYCHSQESRSLHGRRDGPEPTPGGVLAAHGAGSTPQYRRHRPQRMAVGQAQTQGLTVFSTQVCVALFCHGNTLAHQGL